MNNVLWLNAFLIPFLSFPLFLLFKKEIHKNLFARITKILKLNINIFLLPIAGMSPRERAPAINHVRPDTTRGKTSNERPRDTHMHVIALTIHIWLIPFHESVAPAACFVYVPGETGSSPRIPMAVLMECANGCFTNQQRSVTGASAGIIGATANAAIHN